MATFWQQRASTETPPSMARSVSKQPHRLPSEPSPPSPQAYNITNDAPLPFWDFVSQVLTQLGYQAPSRRLPYWLVYWLALLLHLLCLLLRPVVTIQPTFTPMRVALAGTHHYYSCRKAQQEFGYSPLVPFAEGVRRTVQHFSHLKRQ